VDVQPAQFGAAVELREYLAGIEQSLGIEGALHTLLLAEVDLGKHDRHQIALFDADSVLASQNAANLDTQLQNFGSKFLGLVQLAGDIGIVENEGVQLPSPA